LAWVRNSTPLGQMWLPVSWTGMAGTPAVLAVAVLELPDRRHRVAADDLDHRIGWREWMIEQLQPPE
jgi:hypothetical protein